MLSGWGRAQRYDRWWRLAGAAEQVAGQVPGVVGGERREGAGGQRDGAVGVAAGAAAMDQWQPPAEASCPVLYPVPATAARLIHLPASPPSSAHPTGGAPPRPSTARMVVPWATSTTPGRGTAPPRVTRAVPGSAGVPTAAYQAEPNRAISPT